LYKTIKEVLPSNISIFEDFSHPSLSFSVSGRAMQLDIFVPELNLALEYHGTQHYFDHKLFGKASDYSQRDQEKRKACRLSCIALIEVPYWWERDKATIEILLHSHRPDIVLHELEL